MSTLLYNNSCYNLLEAASSTLDIVMQAKKLNYTSVAICDEEVMFGVIEFYHAAIKANIKPIIGLSINVEYKDSFLHFCLYAKNQTGYQNLMYLSSQLQMKKKLKFSDLFAFEEDLFICLLFDSPYFMEDFSNIVTGNLAQKILDIKRNLTFYFAISNQDMQYYHNFNEVIRDIAKENQLECVALPRSLYPTKDKSKLLLVLKAIKIQSIIGDSRLSIEENKHMLTLSELESYFTKEELSNAQVIAEGCNVSMDLPKASMPKYNNYKGTNSKEFLTSLCKRGLAKRLNNQVTIEYSSRLNQELEIITKMNYEDYFLLVYDFVLFAKKNGISTGPGRGSAAGSLVSYCLGITHLDPIKYQLLFERFLNPERISMPDIDTDISDIGRGKVVEYLFNEHPDNKVAHIITFGTFKAKQAIRDVAKVYGVPLAQIDQLAKAIPNDINLNLSNIMQSSPRFKQMVENDSRYKEIYYMARQLEFLPRHSSTHAAGIVLADQSIYKYVPIAIVNDLVSTQFTMNYLEQFGLIKMDLLGLRNLTIIDDICKLANIDNIYQIPLNEPKVYQTLSKAQTLGVFQLESSGMRNLLLRMKPRDFEDIIAILALYRPGPMQYIDLYLDNRSKPDNIDYGHPDLKPILKNTYGIMVYQEQIMQVVQKMAGFSLGKADILRKAISKKKESEITALKSDFITGCNKNGYTLQIANKIFSMIERFANYGFNRSHSAAYALIAYQCAYLKTFYPLEFYQSLLNSVIGNEKKTNEYIVEARKNGVKILPPDVNKSGIEFIIEDNALRFPLTSIKGIGGVYASNFVEIRNTFGPYKDIYDFFSNNVTQKSSTAIVESLIKVGALDCFKESRQTLLNSLDDILEYCGLIKENKDSFSELDLTEYVKKPILTIGHDNLLNDLNNEQKLTGVFFGKHPTEIYKENNPNKLVNISDIFDYDYVSVVGMVTKVKQHRTKTGQTMAFIDLEDVSGSCDCVIMPDVYSNYSNVLKIGGIFLVNMAKDRRGGYLVKSMVKY